MQPCERSAAIWLGIAAFLSATAVIAADGATARQKILDGYAAQAAAADPAFDGFSADRGQALYLGPHPGGKPETRACAVCHTGDPRNRGTHYRTGRGIEPMAVSAYPARFTDPADVEKRFGRDCPNVLGRECTALEKGDFITFLAGR